MSEDSVFAFVRRVIEGRLDAGLSTPHSWIVNEAASRLIGDYAGEHVDELRICVFAYIAQVAKRCCGRYEPSTVRDEQLVMPGFEHVQRGYSNERNGENVIVPIDEMTDAEIESKAREYERMAAGCIAHAKELRNYVLKRGAPMPWPEQAESL